MINHKLTERLISLERRLKEQAQTIKVLSAFAVDTLSGATFTTEDRIKYIKSLLGDNS